MFFNKNDIIKEASSYEMDINLFVSITEMFLDNSDNDYQITTEAMASWEALKVDFSDIKKESKAYWLDAKKLENGGKYKEALRLYDKAIAKANEIYKIIDKIPDENIGDFLGGFIPYVSFALWGVILGGVLKTGKIKGASRAYAKSINDGFIKGLKMNRDKCLEKSKK